MFEVIRAGSLTTFQDLGRPGLAHLGVPPSGAADKRSLRIANRLVGNDESATVLETTLRGPVLAVREPVTVALAGAPSNPRSDKRPLAMHAVAHLAPGDVLDVGVATAGVRTYLAVRGGFEAREVLGSCSSDLLTGLGPAPLAAGDRLELADRAREWPAAGLAPALPSPETPCLRVIPGPRDDWFEADTLTVLCAGPWSVTAASNRVGVRLAGRRLCRRDERELPSEGVVAGAIEVPPSGEPILLLADHPVTGGYPVLCVVAYDDLPLVGQLRPGADVLFRVASPPG